MKELSSSLDIPSKDDRKSLNKKMEEPESDKHKESGVSINSR